MIDKSRHTIKRTLIFTTLALIAFAANSVLCRLALGENSIDAPSFTVLRLLSGALVFLAILKISNNKKNLSSKGSWFASIMIFLYAITFSYAYTTLDTGTGALILFGSVQITIIILSLFTGIRLHITEWLGVLVVYKKRMLFCIFSCTNSVRQFILSAWLLKLLIVGTVEVKISLNLARRPTINSATAAMIVVNKAAKTPQ